MIQSLINRFKQRRTRGYLTELNRGQYAFVGIGQHSLTNLYPVLRYLGVSLKYICCTSEEKARLIGQKFPDVKATASLDEILHDEAVRGVFVSASPQAHFTLASKILQAGKALYIEKPPCQTSEELEELIRLQERAFLSPRPLEGWGVVCVGLQKRYAPAVQLLKKRLRKGGLLSYDLHYLTGAYPEGDARLDLFIHPLDLVTYLFGPARIVACRKTDEQSYLLMLEHEGITGTLELSTHHMWTDMQESLTVCTKQGRYELRQLEELTFTPMPTTILGVPMEKVRPTGKRVEYLYQRNLQNSIVSQGYFGELKAFVDAVEGRGNRIVSDFAALRDTYQLLSTLR